ncbi:MAG: hypothetical protein B9S32_12815 [Verrucomicrobia bacterium Tous-C9LFEB]|nr:MAG: hypothetical protein B9S32_12815 [Verrucomicrobia bacterium Tous-C9LFEB]
MQIEIGGNRHVKIVYFGLWILSFGVLQAASTDTYDQLKTADGLTYNACTVTKVEPDGLTIIYSDGAAKIPFSKLPTDIQQKYNFDPNVAQKYTTEQVARRKAQAQANLEALETAERIKKLKEAAYRVELKISQITPSGAIAKCIIVKQEDVVEKATVPDPTALRPDRVREETRKRTIERRTKLDEPIWVTGLPSSLVDGDSWEGFIWFTGTKDYTTVIGASKRVRSATADIGSL